MYYLGEKQFVPFLILISIGFIPIILGLIIGTILFFRYEILLILLLISVVFFILLFIGWIDSKRKDQYLFLEGEKITIRYPNINNGDGNLILYVNQITGIEYYKLSSIRSWFMLFSYILPKCVFITYTINGNEKTDFIGYMDLNELKSFTKNFRINLVIH